MANPNNRFLSEKDRKKAESDLANIYTNEIEQNMRRGMAAEWQSSDANNIKRLPSAPSVHKVLSGESQRLIYDMKKKDEEKLFSRQKAEEEAKAKNHKSPYVRSGKETTEEFEARQKKGKEDFKKTREKYPIVDQAAWLFDNTLKPLTEGVLKASGDTIGEAVTNKYVNKAIRSVIPDVIENKDVPNAEKQKENLRNYLDEREKAQHGIGKAVYKTGEIGTNLALSSTISNKLPFIGKLDTLTKSSLVNRALREGTENALMGAGTDFFKGDTDNFVVNRFKDFGGGAIFGAGMEGIGQIGRKLSGQQLKNLPNIPKPIEANIPKPIETNIPKPNEISHIGSKDINLASIEPPQAQNTIGKVNTPPEAKNVPQPFKQVLTPQRQLSEETIKKLEQVDAEHKNFVEGIKKSHSNEEMKQKRLKAEGMQHSAIKREIIQGDSLEPVEGGLTEIELNKKVERLYKNTIGKNIVVENKEGTIINNTYGKVKVSFTDGTTKTYRADDIPKQLPLDYGKKTPVEAPPIPNETIATSETAYTSLGDTAISKMRSNTYENADFMQDAETKNIVDKISGEYEVLHDKDLIESSKIGLEEDFSNRVETLIRKSEGLEKGLMDAEDITQAGMITKKMIDESKTTGNTEQLKDWLKKIRIQATSLGQAVHAISTWKNQTPEGMLLKTQKTIDAVITNMRAKNPKKVEMVENMAEESKIIVNDILNKIHEIEPSKSIEEILSNPSNVVKTLIDNATTNKVIKDEIQSAIKDKTLDAIKISENILNKNGIPSLTDNDIKFITEKMEKIQTLSNSREKDIEYALVRKLIAEKIPATTKDKILAVQRINLLLNTKTNIRNITGNMIMGGLENVKDVVATPIDKVVSKWTGQRTTTIPSITEQLKGFVKGIREGIEDSKLGIDTSKMAGRYADLNDVNSFKDARSQAFRKIENPKTVVEHLNNLASRSEKLTGTLLSMGDRPFFEAAFSGSLAQQLKLNGGEVTEEMVEKAIKDAEERTFQNVNKLVTGMQYMKKGLNWIGKEFTGTEFNLGDIALPYVKTPANILSKAIDYSPIGGVKGFAKIVKGIKTGALDQKSAVDQLSRGLTGSALIFAGYNMAKSGVIYGKGSPDADVKALEKQAGKLPYSIKSGNTYTTIDWIQPAAIPLMIGADIYEQKKTDKEAQNIILNAVTSGGKTLLEQSLLTGLTDLFGGYGASGGDKIIDGVKRTALNGATQFLPYGSALNQITKLTDSNVRNTYDGDMIKGTLLRTQAKIPFKSEELPKKYTTVGKEIKQNYGATGLANTFQTLINPATTSKFNPSPAEKLALDLYERSGETIQMPRLVDKTVNYKTEDGTKNGRKETLNLNGKDQSTLQRIMGEKTEKAFQEISETREFENMTDQEKAAELQKLMTKIKREAELELLDLKQLKYKK